MRLLLDFDGTLFNTELLVEKIRNIFAPYGVTSADLEASYRAVYGVYTPKKHIEELEKRFGYLLNQKSIYAKLASLFRNGKIFLYDDTLYFLSLMGKERIPMVMVSIGDSAWQKRKLNACGITSFFEKICILHKTNEGKNQIIEKLCSSSSGPHIFIDDKPSIIKSATILKRKFPYLTIIHILRGNHTDEDAGSPDFTISNLKEARRIILRLRKKYVTKNL